MVEADANCALAEVFTAEKTIECLWGILQTISDFFKVFNLVAFDSATHFLRKIVRVHTHANEIIKPVEADTYTCSPIIPLLGAILSLGLIFFS